MKKCCVIRQFFKFGLVGIVTKQCSNYTNYVQTINLQGCKGERIHERVKKHK